MNRFPARIALAHEALTGRTLILEGPPFYDARGSLDQLDRTLYVREEEHTKALAEAQREAVKVERARLCALFAPLIDIGVSPSELAALVRTLEESEKAPVST